MRGAREGIQDADLVLSGGNSLSSPETRLSFIEMIYLYALR